MSMASTRTRILQGPRKADNAFVLTHGGESDFHSTTSPHGATGHPNCPDNRQMQQGAA